MSQLPENTLLSWSLGRLGNFLHDLILTTVPLGLLEYQIFGPMGVLFFPDELHRP